MGCDRCHATGAMADISPARMKTMGSTGADGTGRPFPFRAPLGAHAPPRCACAQATPAMCRARISSLSGHITLQRAVWVPGRASMDTKAHSRRGRLARASASPRVRAWPCAATVCAACADATSCAATVCLCAAYADARPRGLVSMSASPPGFAGEAQGPPTEAPAPPSASECGRCAPKELPSGDQASPAVHAAGSVAGAQMEEGQPLCRSGL